MISNSLMPSFFAPENSEGIGNNYFDPHEFCLSGIPNASVLSVSSVAKLSTILRVQKADNMIISSDLHFFTDNYLMNSTKDLVKTILGNRKVRGERSE